MQNEASGWFAAASMASLTVIAAAMAAAAEPSEGMEMMGKIEKAGRSEILASRCGAALDGDPDACTGTDDRATLQAAIELLHAGGGGTLVIDGVAALAGALSVPSNIRIVGAHGRAGFCMKTNSGGCAIRNAHFVSGYNNGSPVADGSTIIDHNITLESLFINGGNAVNSGNGRNGLQFDSAGQYVGTVRLYGTKNTTIRNVTILNSPAFSFHLANTFFLIADGNRCYYSDCLAGKLPSRQHAGFQCQGPMSNCLLLNSIMATADDPIGLNADDWCLLSDTGNHLKGPTAFGGAGGWTNVFRGPITDVMVDGLTSIYSMCAGRIFSGSGNIPGATTPSLVDRVTFRNVRGRFFEAAFHLQLQDLSTGHLGSITLENWDIQRLGGHQHPLLFSDGNCKSLTIRNVKLRDLSGQTDQSITISGGSHGSLLIDGLDVYEDGNSAGSPLVKISGGTVTLLRVSNSSWIRAAGLTPGISANPFVLCKGAPTIGTIQLNGIALDYVRNAVQFDASFSGTIGRVQADAVTHANSAGTDGIVRNDSAVTVPVRSGANVTSGSATQNTGKGSIQDLK
ncbi:MAG: hypothetical protein WCI95_11360 [bacterium]